MAAFSRWLRGQASQLTIYNASRCVPASPSLSFGSLSRMQPFVHRPHVHCPHLIAPCATRASPLLTDSVLPLLAFPSLIQALRPPDRAPGPPVCAGIVHAPAARRGHFRFVPLSLCVLGFAGCATQLASTDASPPSPACALQNSSTPALSGSPLREAAAPPRMHWIHTLLLVPSPASNLPPPPTCLFW